MSGVSWVVVVVVLAVALVDWFAVGRGVTPLEYVAKPGTMVAMIALALTLDPDGRRLALVAFAIALLFSLSGDVFLMLPTEAFIAGLASFALAHVAYAVGLASVGLHSAGALIGLAVVAPLLGAAGVPIWRAAKRRDAALSIPVALYMTVIGVMAVLAFATETPLAAVGACLFVLSDSLLGFGRFVGPQAGGRVAVHATYHLGQLGLVLALPHF